MSTPSPSPSFLVTAAKRVLTTMALLMAVIIGPAHATTADGDATLPHFDILEYDVQGNTKLSDLDIERAVTPYLGPDRTLKDVEAARSALEKAYHDAGYLTVLVSIPEQKVDEGNVILSVTEGKIERLYVKGTDYHLASGVRRQVPELAQDSVPYFPKVQRELDALNRTPDLKATPVLKAGRMPGTVDVSLEVDDQLPLHGNLELNNRQSPGTKPLRLSASARYDNLWQLGHSLGLTAQISPQATEQMKVAAVNYALPLDRQGDALALYAVHSSSNVPGPTSVLNNSDIAGLRFALPLPPTDNYGHSMSIGLDYKNIHRVEGMVGGTASTTLQPAITYVPLVAAYNGAWLEKNGTTRLDATTTLGLRGLFGNRDSEFDAKRPGASAQFAILRAGIDQTQNLDRWTLYGRAEAQLASGLLVPNEQYAAGGIDNVRGYLESEQTGDRAVRVSLEVRTPSVSVGSTDLPLRLTGLGFYDVARLTSLQYDPYTGSSLPSLHYLLRGAGIGLRVSGPKGLSFDLDIARALDDGGNSDINTKAGDVRVHSRLVWEFL